jgi:hypothetical protein
MEVKKLLILSQLKKLLRSEVATTNYMEPPYFTDRADFERRYGTQH